MKFSYAEISSSVKSFVFGPKPPIVITMTAIAPAMNRATAPVPPSRKRNPMPSPASAALTRLQAYTNPTARARIRVGNSSL